MCKRMATLIGILFIISPLSLCQSAADTTPINTLIEKALELGGYEVTVQGEAIGECMNRGEYSWVNINDTSNAIGIWLHSDDAKKIQYFGNYQNKGDILRMTGTFYRACIEHGGEADLHCSTFEIVEKGHPVREQISVAKIVATVFFLSLASLLLLYFLKMVRNKTLHQK